MKRVILLCLALLLVQGTAFAADSIKIGLMGPITGPWASEGAEMKQVVQLLAEELNQKGGLLGKKVEVITEDDGETRERRLLQHSVWPHRAWSP